MEGIGTVLLLLLFVVVISWRLTKFDPLVWFRRWRDQRAAERDLDEWHKRDRP